MNKSLLIMTIGIHYVVFISFLCTATLGIIYLPWYVAITLTSLIVRVIFDREECPLTTYENKLRRKLDIVPSTGFMKDYIFRVNKTINYLYKKLRN